MKFARGARALGMYIMPALVLMWLFWTDPDQGDSTAAMLQNAMTAGLGVTFAYVARKLGFPYISLEELIRLSKGGNVAAAIAALGVFIFMAVLVVVFSQRAHAQNVQTYVPAGAYTYAPVLKAEQVRLWPNHVMPSMLAALVEQESCIGLKHSRCWNPAARLKRVDEEGAGFGQITRAYRSDGTLRFDALAEVRQLDPQLLDLSWENVYRRPDLQLRAILVMSKDCDRRLQSLVADPVARLHLCDAAYNGGYAGMQRERRACGQRAGCDPQKWFGHVELTCLKSKKPERGYNRSPCAINREHVHLVSNVRRVKYIPLMEST